MAENLGDLVINIQARLNDLESKMDTAESRGNKAASRIGESFKRMAGTIAAAFSIRAVTQFFESALDKYAKQELAEKKLEAQLGRTNKRLLNYAAALQKKTQYGDEDTISAMAMLAAFTKDEDQIKRLTKVTLDLAAAKGFDLASSADLVGKSFGSSTNALTRYGIEVKGAAGSQERLNSLIENTNKLFGGQAEAQAKTYTGTMAQLKNSIGDAMEKIGGSLVPLIGQVTDFVKLFIPMESGLATTKQRAFELSFNFDNLTATYLRLRGNTSKTKEETALYQDTIAKLNDQYPNYLKNVDLHKSKINDVKTAFMNARIELDNYINSLMKQAIIEQNKDKIAELATALGSYTYILNQLKNAQESVAAGKGDPFGKLTPNQRAQMQNDPYFRYRISSAFTFSNGTPAEQLQAQIDDVESKIGKLTDQRKKIQLIIKGMLEAFKDAEAPAGGGKLGGGKIEKTAEQIKKEQDATAKFYDYMKYASADYLVFYMKQVTAEADVFLKAGQSKVEVQKYVAKKLKEYWDGYAKYIKENPAGDLFLSAGGSNSLFNNPTGGDNTIDKNGKVKSSAMKYVEMPKQPLIEYNKELSLTDQLGNQVANTFASTLASSVRIFGQANSFLQQFVNSLAQAVIQMLALKAAQALISWSWAPFGFATGGSVTNFGAGNVSVSKVPGFASGASFTVPPTGRQGDSFLMSVAPGERVDVTAAQKTPFITSASNARELLAIKDSIDGLHLMLAEKSFGSGDVYLDSEKISKKVQEKTNRLKRSNYQVQP